MTKFPNQEGLNKALNIYRSAMRSFIVCCLEKVHPKGVEELIVNSLNNKAANKFEQDLHLYKGNIEASIDINTFPHIIRNRWDDVFEQQFNPDSNVRNVISLIVDGRNQCAHLDIEDLYLDYTWTYLFLISDVLSQINQPDARREIETILDELFPDDTDERIANMTKQLDAAKAEKTELEKLLKGKSEQLEEVEVEWIACHERLETVSTQLKIALEEKTVAEERFSDISNQFEEAKVENAELEKRLSETKNRLRTVKSEKDELEECLEIRSTELEDVKVELDAGRANKVPEPLPPNPNPPDSVTFQGTIFTKYLDEYHATEDDISQSFWHYWHAQGREGKQEMRDAGWGVEEVDREWEVIVSPEDFQAWIMREVRKLNNVFNSPQEEEPSTQSIRPSYERTSLPTVKEMEQPALELFADRKEHRRVEMIDLLTEHFSLDDEERRYISKTGQVEKHLMKEGLIERTRTGYYRITTYGLEVVNDVPF